MLNDGEKTLKPVVLSASRSTDIPAFYADWLVDRLKAGYCTWTNPFNRDRFRVSFEDVRAIVFWSKNPRPLIRHLDDVNELGFKNFYFQFTVNDYEREGLEPNVPSLTSRIDTFRELSAKIGRSRVIWRFDPLLLTSTVTVDVLLNRIQTIGRQLKGCTEKLVFSFADIEAYRKVVSNLRGTGCREFSVEEQEAFACGLADINEELGFVLATCAEEIDFSRYGIVHNKCVDDDLMVRLFHDDQPLMEFLGAEYDMIDGWHIAKSKKDKGQRKACSCVVSKDIGMYNTCLHLCRYCYANSSDATVLANCKKHHAVPWGSALIPDETE